MQRRSLPRHSLPMRYSPILISARRMIAMVRPHSTRTEGSTQEQLAVVRSVLERAVSAASVALVVVQGALEVLGDGVALVLTSTSMISLGRLLAKLVVAAGEAHSNSRSWWVKTSRFRQASLSWMLQRVRRKASLLRQWSSAVAAVGRA